MKTIVFPAINENDTISSNLINNESDGIILVMRGEDYIGYILCDYTSDFYFSYKMDGEDSPFNAEQSLNELVNTINKYYITDGPISYKYIEFIK